VPKKLIDEGAPNEPQGALLCHKGWLGAVIAESATTPIGNSWRNREAISSIRPFLARLQSTKRSFPSVNVRARLAYGSATLLTAT
jgi:hypothetical protein